MRKKLILVLFLAAAIMINFVGCSGSVAEAKQEAEKKEKEETIPVEVTTVITGDISAYFTGTASLEAEGEAKVVAKTSGVVEKIFVEEGQKVKEGQLLAQLDDDRLVLDLKQAQARLNQLEREFKRNSELFKKKIISAELYDRVQSDYEMQKTQVERATLLKNYTSIRAPIGGVVAERMIKRGNMLQQDQQCFHITDFDPLLAILHVPEKELSKLKKDQKAFLEVDALKNERFKGKILRISPVVSRETGTFKVTVAVTDPAGKLKHGMFSRVRIVYDVRKNTLLVPKDAVLTEGKEKVVFVVKDKKASRKLVEVGYINTTHLEIKSGLQKGDTIVQTGQGALKDGDLVDILEPNKAKDKKPQDQQTDKKHLAQS